MGKIIRLTESDLIKLVKRVLKEEELSSPTGEKSCVPEIRKLYAANGFVDGGVFGDGMMHEMILNYEKPSKKGAYVNEKVMIQLIDWRGGGSFMVEIRETTTDPKVTQLLSKRYTKMDDRTDSSFRLFRTKDLNCDTAKMELQKNIKPLERELIQMGYKKVS